MSVRATPTRGYVSKMLQSRHAIMNEWINIKQEKSMMEAKRFFSPDAVNYTLGVIWLISLPIIVIYIWHGLNWMFISSN